MGSPDPAVTGPIVKDVAVLAHDLPGRARRVRSATTLSVLAIVVALLASACEDPTTATVKRVVDGDTIDVVVEGDERRVRLLNIDTPESVDPDAAVECLGPEATEFLATLLPEGTAVTLAYDEVRTDRYGRDLAAVFHDEAFVNAEIARAGLATTLVVDGNDRYYDEVEKARAEAEAAGAGMYSPDVPCTPVARVAEYEGQVGRTVSQAPGSGATLAELDAYGETLAALAVAGAALDAALSDGDGFVARLPRSTVRSLAGRVDRSEASVQGAQDRQRSARAAEEERLAAAEAARVAEEQRVAAEREAARLAEAAEAARAEEARRVEEQRRAAVRTRESGGTGSSGGSGSSGGGSAPERSEAPPAVGGYDGYTGCRAYGKGGTSVDEKGRPYTKIDCTTKLPLG